MNINMQSVLEAVVNNIPAPAGDENAALSALIFDSFYDSYKGVIVYIRMMDGTLKTGDRIKMMATGAEFEVVECGFMRPLGLEQTGVLRAGDVGYFTASIKNVENTRVGAVSYTHLEVRRCRS